MDPSVRWRASPIAKFVDKVAKGFDWYTSAPADTDRLEFARHDQLVDLAAAYAQYIGGLFRG